MGQPSWRAGCSSDTRAAGRPLAEPPRRSRKPAANGSRPALLALAVAHLQMGEPAEADEILVRLVDAAPDDPLVRRLNGQAALAAGKVDEAVQQLEAARAAAPDDLELAFALGGAYLSRRRPTARRRVFARHREGAADGPDTPADRPRVPRAGEYERARGELRRRPRDGPARARRAHYYLGMLSAQEGGPLGLEAAIEEFRAELALAPGDAAGEAWSWASPWSRASGRRRRCRRWRGRRVRSRRSRARCTTSAAPSSRAKRSADAAASLRRALELARGPGGERARAARDPPPARPGAARDRRATRRPRPTSPSRRACRPKARTPSASSLARYLADAPDAADAPRARALPVIEASPLAALRPAAAAAMRTAVTSGAGARVPEPGRPAARRPSGSRRAAELLEKAAAARPGLGRRSSPRSGVACFNARPVRPGHGPAGARAVAASPGDRGPDAHAGAWRGCNLESYAKAAELLRRRPGARERTRRCSSRTASRWCKSDRARGGGGGLLAPRLARTATPPELSVMLGQAHAQQGDFDAAIEALQRALRLKAGRGRGERDPGRDLPAAGQAGGGRGGAARGARGAPRGRPASQQNLAIVLELAAAAAGGDRDPAARLLAAKPDLVRRALPAGQDPAGPGRGRGGGRRTWRRPRAWRRRTPSIHYQLGRAYQKLGRTEQAEQQFEVFRRLKDKPQSD